MGDVCHQIQYFSENILACFALFCKFLQIFTDFFMSIFCKRSLFKLEKIGHVQVPGYSGTWNSIIMSSSKIVKFSGNTYTVRCFMRWHIFKSIANHIGCKVFIKSHFDSYTVRKIIFNGITSINNSGCYF